MAGERVVFTEESDPHQYVKLVAAGEIDDILLDAIANFVSRQRRRLQRSEHKGQISAVNTEELETAD